MAQHRNVTVIHSHQGEQLASVCFRVEGHESTGDDIGLSDVAAAVAKISGEWIVADGDSITISINERG